MTRDEIMGLTGRGLDWAVGREVMGYSVYHYDKGYRPYWLLWDRRCNPLTLSELCSMSDNGEREREELAWGDCPNFSTDANAVREMESEIDQIWTAGFYIGELCRILAPDRPRGVQMDLWLLKTATPQQCCHAALLAVLENEGENRC